MMEASNQNIGSGGSAANFYFPDTLVLFAYKTLSSAPIIEIFGMFLPGWLVSATVIKNIHFTKFRYKICALKSALVGTFLFNGKHKQYL